MADALVVEVSGRRDGKGGGDGLCNKEGRLARWHRGKRTPAEGGGREYGVSVVP